MAAKKISDFHADFQQAPVSFVTSDVKAYELDPDSTDTAKVEWWTASKRGTPLQRRRAIGDANRCVDSPGFWVHVRCDPKGVPTVCELLSVNDEVTQFMYIGSQSDGDWRSIERLPAEGVYVFLW